MLLDLVVDPEVHMPVVKRTDGTPTPDMNGVAGTGGGGGGGAGDNPGQQLFVGQGGSGLVVVRYQIGSVQTNTAKATGGSISFYNNKTIHTFTNSGTMDFPSSFSETVEYVVIGGGGSGGYDIGGGGGAGGYLTGTTPISGPAPGRTVTVGAGGNPLGPIAYPLGNARNGNPGEDSSFAAPAGTITAGGGAGGASRSAPTTGQNASSGSGGAYPPNNQGNIRPAGNDGGDGAGPQGASAGGGGAGGAGKCRWWQTRTCW